MKQKSLPSQTWRRVIPFAFITMLGVCLLLQAAPVTHAQSGQFSFNVSPLLIELSASPGGVAYFDINVINQSRTNAATFNVRVASIRERTDGSFEVLLDPDVPYSAASWIATSTDRFTVNPGQGHTIMGQVTVPRNVQGGRYAAVLLELEPEEKSDAEANAATIIRYRLASIIELTIGSRFNRRAHISELEVLTGDDLPFLARQFGPNALMIYAALTNEGDIHVKGRGTLHIHNQDGRKVREMPLGTGRGVVYPGGTLHFSSILPAGLPAGTYRLQAVVNYGGIRPAIATREVTIDSNTILGGRFEGGPEIRFNVAPEEINLQLPAGARRIEAITLENHDTVPVRIKGKAQPLIFDDYGELDVVAMEEAAGFEPWVEISPAELVLQPGQRRNVRLAIDAGPEYQGGKYAHLAFDATELDPAEDGRNGHLSAMVSLSSRDGHRVAAEVTDLRILPPTAVTPLGIEFRIKNTGNIHFQGSGTLALARYVVPESIDGIIIDSGSYETIWSGPLPEDVLRKVLPGEDRVITGSVTEPVEPGLYRVTLELNQGSRPLATAQVEFEISPPGVPGATLALDAGESES